MLGSNSDVEDIAQQVFIRVWKSARRYVPRAKFTTWLLKITRNLVFNELRRSKRHAHVPLQTDPGAEEFPLKDEKNPAPDASLLQTELQLAIEDAITQLPESQRIAPILRRYEQPRPRGNLRSPRSIRASVKTPSARKELRARLSRYWRRQRESSLQPRSAGSLSLVAQASGLLGRQASCLSFQPRSSGSITRPRTRRICV
jgi:RNA polymerase sigma-70 factor (ECF subfamily)